MNLRADNDGFLVGEAPADLSAERDRLQLLRAIKADTAAMRKALSAAPQSRPMVEMASAATQIARVMRQRPPANDLTPPPVASPAAGDRLVVQVELAQEADAGSVLQSPAPPSVAAPAAIAPAPAASLVAPPPPAMPAPRRQSRAPSDDRDTAPPAPVRRRGADGRFSAAGAEREQAEPSGGDPSESRGERRLLAGFGRAIDKLRESVSGALQGTEQVDPAIAAAKEVGDIVAPIAAPVQGLFGMFGDRDERDERREREGVERKISVPWYRRLWQELRELNEKPAGGSGDGRLKLGGIGGMLMKLPGIGMLGRMLGGLGGALRPLIGLAAKAALPLAAMFSAVRSFSTSTEEYAARMGIELNGSLVQELGVRFVGVLGDFGNTLTFGLAGKFGEYIAPAVTTMIDGILERWDKSTAWLETKWGEVTGKFDAVVEGVRKWFAGKFGGLADKAQKAGKVISDKATGVKTAVVERAADAKEAAGTWVADKADKVASVFGGGSAGRKQAVQAEMARAGITDPREQAMFMAQMDHESNGFKAAEESFNYRNADRLMAVSGTARKKGKQAVEAAMAEGPEAVAELMYGGRMGNTEKGDGYKYRGRGAIQLTGKDNYAAASKDLGLDLVGNPDLAADPAVAAKVATWYWKKNNLGDAARRGDVTAVTKRINGGTNGLADRKEKYDAYLAAANTGKLAIEDGAVAARSVTPEPSPAEAARPSPSPIPLRQSVAPAAPVAQAQAPAVPSAPAAPPSAQSLTPSPIPVVPQRVASNESKAQPPLVIEQPLTQNLADRGLAQAATGGIGMNLGGR